jgi:tryptophan synthase alpha chain
MNRIKKLFNQNKKNILSIYFTAGFPQLNDTTIILNALQNHGTNLIEIGMPYSDPLADGPVIQASGMKALLNGMTIKLLFEQLKNCREEISVPLILMGYLNPVMQYGIKRFCADAKNAGIDGIILPDLPIAEYRKEYKKILKKNNLIFIFLITPETSVKRIKEIDKLSTGFIYAVSSSSITGVEKNMEAQESYFQRLKSMNLKNEVIIGFGIKDHTTFQQACKHAAGAIIGTAYIKAIENSVTIDAGTQKFINSILQ